MKRYHLRINSIYRPTEAVTRRFWTARGARFHAELLRAHGRDMHFRFTLVDRRTGFEEGL